MISSYLGSPEMADIRKAHKDFDRVFDKIEALIAENAPDGKYVLEENSVWISISSYETKPEADSKFEAHRDFLDIQLMLEGKERIGFADREDLVYLIFEQNGELMLGEFYQFSYFAQQDFYQVLASVAYCHK